MEHIYDIACVQPKPIENRPKLADPNGKSKSSKHNEKSPSVEAEKKFSIAAIGNASEHNNGIEKRLNRPEDNDSASSPKKEIFNITLSSDEDGISHELPSVSSLSSVKKDDESSIPSMENICLSDGLFTSAENSPCPKETRSPSVDNGNDDSSQLLVELEASHLSQAAEKSSTISSNNKNNGGGGGGSGDDDGSSSSSSSSSNSNNLLSKSPYSNLELKPISRMLSNSDEKESFEFEYRKSIEKRELSGEPLDVLLRYRDIPIPNRVQTINFVIHPGMSSSGGFSMAKTSFTRSNEDEEEMALVDWGLPMFFYVITKKHFFTLFSACVLEKRIGIISSDLRVLSSVVLSFIPLLRPFFYQSLIIPILPIKLCNLLEAPVPYIIGVSELPRGLMIPDDVVLANLDQQTLTHRESIPRLPRFKEFAPEFDRLFDELHKTFVKGLTR